jgi:hypothetical protein
LRLANEEIGGREGEVDNEMVCMNGESCCWSCCLLLSLAWKDPWRADGEDEAVDGLLLGEAGKAGLTGVVLSLIELTTVG